MIVLEARASADSRRVSPASLSFTVNSGEVFLIVSCGGKYNFNEFPGGKAADMRDLSN